MGLIVLDAGLLIGFLDANDSHHPLAHQYLSDAVDRNARLVMPASALAEAMVGPCRSGAVAVATVVELIAHLPIEIVPLDDRVAIAAAQLRADHRSLKLPDALVIATAQILRATELVTTDRKWPSQRELELHTAITTLGAPTAGDGD